MGYYTREGMVEENRDILEMILRAITSNQELAVDVPHVNQISRVKYFYNNMLKATERLVEECGGRYASLRHMTEVSEDFSLPGIVIRLKKGVPIRSAPHIIEPDEHDALRYLDAHKGQEFVSLVFTPSPTYAGDEWLSQEIDKRGYILITDDIDGTKSYVAKRKEKKRGAFDLLDKYTPPS